MTLFTELKRRNVFKVASVYLVTCWIILQIVSVISPSLHLPVLFSTITTVILAIAFPFVCIFAWAFELTPEGLKRTHEVDSNESISEHTGSKINYILIIALVLALGFIAYEKIFLANTDDSLERSIAVLPFEDMSPDKSQGYFGDGIAEEILNSLARLDQLVVIARTSSFNFKNSNTDIRDIGRALNVNYVLEGSVRKDKDKLRITAQLIEVASGAHIWSQTYDRTLDSIFAVQDELTYAITQALKLNLLPGDVSHEVGMTSDPEAYELFVQGRELQYQRNPEALQQAARLLQQAIALDEQFHLARAQLYMVYRLATDYGGFTITEQDENKDRLLWPLFSAPNFPLKFLVLADYAEKQNKKGIANRLYEKAYQLAPSDPLVQNIYLLSLQDYDRVIREREKIIKTNPESRINYANLMNLYGVTGRYEEARSLARKYEQKFPDDGSLFFYRINTEFRYALKLEDTLQYIESYAGPRPEVDYIAIVSAGLHLVGGNIDSAFEHLKQALRSSPEAERDVIDSLVLLELLKQNQALSPKQMSLLARYEISEKTKTQARIALELLQGDFRLFEEVYKLNASEAAKQWQEEDFNYWNILLYAAIKKRQGDPSFAQALKPLMNIDLRGCRYPGAGYPRCMLMMYLDGSYSQSQMAAMFEKSLHSMSTSFIGIEAFLHTSPVYYGVRDLPEFTDKANDFLQRTYAQWNPALVNPAWSSE
ncbi:tetratricopeptide repeat protein [Alteromonas halophila]|uniref:FlgO domain-containing protein n=1 Tax=Alteromonas halophila TaxID=516698 RepID=A0A918MV68_9ALTE|nr:hypothetical protein [Alteromonas halophila]GGW74313.1 hypothetical protein GCM10007391_02770 [Alteromonas halophila]